MNRTIACGALLLTLALSVLLPGVLWAQSLEATVERQTVIDGESVVLYLKGESLNELPDVSALNQSFDILDSRRSNSRVIDQGVVRSSFMMRFELLAKKLGQSEIPVFTADSQSSQAIRIDVVERGTAGVVPRDKVFTEITFDKENPYVQSQVIMSLHILDDGSLATVDPQPPIIPDVQVERLPVGDQQIEERDGVEYRVHTWRYALFPQRNGEIEIPRFQIAGSVKDPTYGGNLILRNMATRRISIRTKATTLNVKAKAEQSTADWWLPVEKLELDREWSADIKNSKVGEPLTLTLSLTTQGATSNQLPEILPPDINGLKIYPDVPELVSQPSEKGLISRRREKWSVIPLREGLIEIPAVSLKWWDVATETERTATLPAQQLIVAAADTDASTGNNKTPVVSDASEPTDQANTKTEGAELPDSVESEGDRAMGMTTLMPAQSRAWRWIALLALAGWAVTLLSWWGRSRRRKRVELEAGVVSAGKSDAARQLRELRALSTSENASIFRAAMVDWSHSYWPDNPPVSLVDIGRRLRHESLLKQLHQLDASLYGQQQSSVSLPDIYATLSAAITDHQQPSAKLNADPLPTL